MKRAPSPGPGLVYPASLREPLLEVLSDLLISCWPSPDHPIERFADGLANVVDLLLRGVTQVQLLDAPFGLIENLVKRAKRASDRVTAGSRRRPEAGYSFRLAVQGMRVGAVLLVDVTGAREGDQPLIFLRIAALFSVDEFDGERREILKGEYQAKGLSDALAEALTPKAPVAEQTLDYDLEFDPGTPTPR
ncbi:MAG: hypothetical protein VR76_02180 [Pseudomonas sp. BRH_c35]|jgi:hypothetical protein|nr:MAG: hypothetical protein VR76_02180 [Pseudomonas sp. BRH_c35]